MEVNKREIGALARAVLDYANRKSYGLGECGYYFREWASDYTDSQDQEYIKELIYKAEELAEQLDEQKKTYGV